VSLPPSYLSPFLFQTPLRSSPTPFPPSLQQKTIANPPLPPHSFGPTLCGEWSQADTDCALYLNNVATGSRWEGNMLLSDPSASITTPSCPKAGGRCSCAEANADPSSYSDLYKQWLRMNAEAQMTSFEIGWGWFYWTWVTESSAQWSWKLGMQAGILPARVWERGFNCSSEVGDFRGLSESY